MSIRIMSEVWDLSIPDSRRKLILLALANNANDETRECWPSVAYISKRCGCTRQTVHRHLARLETDGLIKIENRFTEGGRKRSNIYRIAPMVKTDTYPISNVRDNVCNTDDTYVCNTDDTYVCNTGVTKNHNKEPSVEPNPPTPQRTNGAQAKNDTPEFIDNALWDEYLQHRKEIKHKLTETAKRRLFIKLTKWNRNGINVNECISDSIANGWRGIFNETNRKQQAGNSQRETPVQRSERIEREALQDVGFA